MANLDPYVVGNTSKNILGCVLVTHPTMSPSKNNCRQPRPQKGFKAFPKQLFSLQYTVHESLTSAESSPSAGGWVWNLSGKSAREGRTEITKVK